MEIILLMLLNFPAPYSLVVYLYSGLKESQGIVREQELSASLQILEKCTD